MKRYITGLIVTIVMLNLIAWASPDICNWYTRYIFPIGVSVFGRIMNVIPFSVGEVMIILGIFLLLFALILVVLCPFLRKKQNFSYLFKRYYKCLGIILVHVGLVMTLNCTLLYHCSKLDPNPEKENRDYTIAELEILRNHIVEKCNEYAEMMERAENGDIVYDKDMHKEAKKALLNISGTYPNLQGYYPKVKNIVFSDLMSQSYIAGYYFPFSLEANCNRNMYIINYPSTFCHELGHLHGYIYEDEAEFISFLACIESEEDFFVYSGYLEVLNYVNNAYWNNLMQSGNTEAGMERYSSQLSTSELVDYDNMFLKEETWEEVEEDALIQTETMDEISDKFTDISIKINGVEEGIAAYSGVVELLLQYYDGTLY